MERIDLKDYLKADLYRYGGQKATWYFLKALSPSMPEFIYIYLLRHAAVFPKFSIRGFLFRRCSLFFEKLQVQALRFPLRHPSFVYADGRPERSLQKTIYRSLPVKSRCMYLLRRVLGAVYYLREVMPYK